MWGEGASRVPEVEGQGGEILGQGEGEVRG